MYSVHYSGFFLILAEAEEWAPPPLPWPDPHLGEHHLHPSHSHWMGDLCLVWPCPVGGVAASRPGWWCWRGSEWIPRPAAKEGAQQNQEKIRPQGMRDLASDVIDQQIFKFVYNGSCQPRNLIPWNFIYSICVEVIWQIPWPPLFSRRPKTHMERRRWRK